MSTDFALPRWGHLDQLHHIFGYPKMNPKRKLFYDPQHPNIDERAFKEHDWYEFYRDTKERLPNHSPKPCGNMVLTHCFVDSEHAGDKVTRRSQTGILIFVNRAPILWYSKRQNTVETSTFGSEFIAVEKSVFSIWVDLLLCRSIQLLVLSYAEMFVYMYLSQLMSTFTNYLKVHHLLDGFFIP